MIIGSCALVRVRWFVFVGSCLLVRVCWIVFIRACLLVLLCWFIVVGSCSLVRVCWLVFFLVRDRWRSWSLAQPLDQPNQLVQREGHQESWVDKVVPWPRRWISWSSARATRKDGLTKLFLGPGAGSADSVGPA